MKEIIVKIFNKMKNILKFIINYFLNIYLRNKYKEIKILSSEETIKYIIDNKVSVCRLGDGEMFIIDKESGIGFQDIDENLSRELYEILKSDADDKILICIPKWMFDKNELNKRTNKSKKWCKRYLNTHFHNWCEKVNLNYTYGDTSFNRRYVSMKSKDNSKNYYEKLKEIWKDRDICIVEGEKTRIGIGNDIIDGAKSVKRIIAPAENAYKKIDEIIAECSKLNKDILFLCALGPTATVLSYKLAKLGYQAIDIGHIDVEYEWLLMKADSVVPIKNKYVNEANAKDENDNFKDTKYESEIVVRI